MRKTLRLPAPSAILPLALLAFVSMPPLTARADTIALTLLGGQQVGPITQPRTIGWWFNVNQDITVTMLGFWDATPATPLGEDHPVGIWTNTGTLLGSATVLTNSPIIDGFRYIDSPPIALSAGQSYVIGALLTPVDGNSLIFAPLTTAPELTYIAGRLAFMTSPNLTFPNFIDPAANGNFGPNFQFVDTAAVIPEPASLTLLGLGVAGLAGYGWRRRKQTA